MTAIGRKMESCLILENIVKPKITIIVGTHDNRVGY